MENVRRTGGEEIVKPLILSSSDAAAIVAEKSFDLIFIDADHASDSVRQDIELWLPKVKRGGILCGHDCEGRIDILPRDALMRGRNEELFCKLAEEEAVARRDWKLEANQDVRNIQFPIRNVCENDVIRALRQYRCTTLLNIRLFSVV